MKTRNLMSVLAGIALLNGCAGAGSGPTGSGGQSAGSGGSSSSSSGGATGSGSGGSGSGSGGSTSSGGKTGSGGTSSSSGGATGSGGASSASGGATSSGGSPGSGGAATSSGGATASGGTAGGAGAKGSGGSAGGSSGGAGTSGGTHWVATWTASPYVDTNSNNTPPFALSNSVIRQVTHVSLGGSQLRVQFSNLQGNGPVTISAAHIALCKATPDVDSSIDTATDKALAFSGMPSVTIDKGKEVWSDTIDFTVAALGNITITTAFGSVPSTLTQHSGSRTTSYFQASSTTVNAANMSSATKKDLWFFISGIDVMADAAAKAVVAIGDSITDGRGTDTNKENRWTDILSSRLQMNAATANVAVGNQGIGATNLAGSGTAAQARFARDVLGQSGVKYAIVLDGVNDIHGGASVDSLKSAYMKLISDAHAKNVKIFGATILPFGGSTSGSDPYYNATAEKTRQDVNTFIKSGVFDGVIDFDAAVTDGGNPPKLKPEYSKWSMEDGLHPGPAGYQKMGDSIDLTLFTK